MIRPLVPSRGCLRAIETGPVIVMGGFRETPPYKLPGWICSVRSKHGRTWLLALLVDEINHKYLCRLLDEIPWGHWIGRANGTEWTVYDGDDPHVGACNHLCAIRGIDPANDSEEA
jgi:hypothetical protein